MRPQNSKWRVPPKWTTPAMSKLCPACGGEKRIGSAEGYRACRRCRGTGDLLEARGIRGRMERMIFDTFEADIPLAKTAVEKCHTWAMAPKGILILTGTLGTGKTHLAVSIIRQAGGRYITLADMVAEIQVGYGHNALITDTEIVKALGAEPLLVLDEVGRQRPSEDARYQIQRVMDERYILERPTVLVSNLPPSEFGAVLGDHIADRLAENHQTVRFEWPSWRRA